MTSEFAKKVFPTFLNVLEVLERINTVRGSAPSIESVRVAVRADLSQFAAGNLDEQLAQRALVFWVDEVFIDSRWGDYWTKNLLEYELFGTRHRAELFFREAEQASALSRPDTLETFYLSAALGFQGIYRAGLRTAGTAPAAGPQPVRTALPEKPVSKADPTVQINFDERTMAESGRGAGPPILEVGKPGPVNPGGRSPMREPSKPTSVSIAPGGLNEWAKRTYERLRPKALEKYQPTWGPDSAGECRPLRGRTFLRGAGAAVLLLGVLGLILFGASAM